MARGGGVGFDGLEADQEAHVGGDVGEVVHPAGGRLAGGVLARGGALQGDAGVESAGGGHDALP